jgi:SIR2-like protein
MDSPPVPAPPTGPDAVRPDAEVPYPFIRSQLLKGRVIPFLGAGASLSARPGGQAWKLGSAFLPSGAELARYLDDRSGYPPGEQVELARVAQYFGGVTGRGGLDDELNEVFSPRCSPGPIHHFLAQVERLLVVTTNYDDLMEQALRAAGRTYRVVVYRTESPLFLYWNGKDPEPQELSANELTFDVAEAPVVFKMHGAVNRDAPSQGSYVITEDDYVEFLARLITTTAIPVVFAEPFRKSHFLFLGYGLRDWSLRVVLHQIYRLWPRRYASWAIQQQANPLERAFWARRDLTIYDVSVTDFAERLAAAGP